MRFKTSIRNISTFTKLTGSLTALGKFAWMHLSEEMVRFAVFPDSGILQAWAMLHVDTIFMDYRIASASDNVINLELPLDNLHRSLKSCNLASSATLRLTKKDQIPTLSLTVATLSSAAANPTIITQDIPVRVVSPGAVAWIQEPTCPEPDVHIMLPALTQLRAVTERFVKLAPPGGKIVLEANLGGCFRMRVEADTVKVQTAWKNLMNPYKDDANGPEESASASQPREKDLYAGVRVEAKDWAKVVKISALSKRVVASFCEDHALILYVYLNDNEEENSAIITYYISSYSA